MRLGHALNFSVFEYEIMQNPTAAHQIAKESLDQALDLMDECEQTVSRELHTEAQSIINCLQENMNAW